MMWDAFLSVPHFSVDWNGIRDRLQIFIEYLCKFARYVKHSVLNIVFAVHRTLTQQSHCHHPHASVGCCYGDTPDPTFVLMCSYAIIGMQRGSVCLSVSLTICCIYFKVFAWVTTKALFCTVEWSSVQYLNCYICILLLSDATLTDWMTWSDWRLDEAVSSSQPETYISGHYENGRRGLKQR